MEKRSGDKNGSGEVRAVRSLLEKGSGSVHLVGVGGIGMAGIALHLAGRGFKTSGCDLTESRVTDWLVSRGITFLKGHRADHVSPETGWVVHTAAVDPGHEELRRARELGIPCFRRGTVLPALLHGRTSVAVSGTHGKTTTSAMIAQVLFFCGRDPSFCVGGELDVLGGVAGVGRGGTMVVEADESDATVALYEPDIAVITNIEYDHMEHFKGEEDLVACFEAFARNAGRRLVYCADDPRAAQLGRMLDKSLSYGFSPESVIRGSSFEENPLSSSLTVSRDGRELGRLAVPAPGRHNALNALATVAVGLELGLSFESVSGALARFAPARRRFEWIVNAGERFVISDYAHHPTEIRAVVQSALKLGHRRVIAVFQPHRYTRTKALGPDFPPAFEGLHELVLAPVYEASESPIEGGTSKDLMRYFKDFRRVPVHYVDSLTAAWDYLKGALQPGDLLMVIGAGDVEKIAFWAKKEFEQIER